VVGVLRDDYDFEKAWRGHRAAKNDVRLGARTAELAEDMRGGQEIAVAIDEEGVAIKDVVKATVGRVLVDGIDDGAEGEREVGIANGLSGCGGVIRFSRNFWSRLLRGGRLRSRLLGVCSKGCCGDEREDGEAAHKVHEFRIALKRFQAMGRGDRFSRIGAQI